MPELTPNVLPAKQRCGACRFAGTHTTLADINPVGATMVRCLRYPPTRRGVEGDHATLAQRYADTVYPVTTWDDWCGEYAPRQTRQHGVRAA